MCQHKLTARPSGLAPIIIYSMPRQPLTAESAYAAMAALCARAEHCRADILDKLARRGLPAAEARAAADRLEREGFIDENRYARAFALDKLRYSRWGRMKIRAALTARHLSETDIGEALAAIGSEEYEQAFAASARAKLRSLDNEEPRARREKLARFLLGRGFEAGLVMSRLDTLTDG
ncbi:MAG: RecX family transcriptional regulator [Prevotellaceae bacterium]|nr:RecX family transcriptional regulator [Prevotellaceae bacterium]